MRDQILLEELRLVMKEGFAPLQESFLGKKGFLEQQCRDTVFQELQIGRLVPTGRGAASPSESWAFPPPGHPHHNCNCCCRCLLLPRYCFTTPNSLGEDLWQEEGRRR